MAEEKRKIEPYYQARAKRLVDSLFDLGLLSESLSRDGITGIEGLVALYFQQIAESSAKCAGFPKKYKILGGRVQKDENDNRERHEEEMRWIARAKEAEAQVLEQEDLARWARDVGAFLKDTLSPPYCTDAGKAKRLYLGGVEAGFIPEPDCMPGKIIIPPGLEVCGELCSHSAAPYPGALIHKCPECGGHKIR
jgi:hypothetical protein